MGFPRRLKEIERQCEMCDETKLLAEFPTRYDYKRQKMYHRRVCKTCRPHLASVVAYRKWRHIYMIARRSGIEITESQLDLMYERQGGLCPLCLEREAVVVDHDHETKKVRQLLCHPCNLVVNKNMTPQTLRRGAKYLEIWAERHQN